MRTILLAALAGTVLLAAPARAEEGAGTGRANFYLELARDQARLREGQAQPAARAQPGAVDTFTRSRADNRRPARPSAR